MQYSPYPLKSIKRWLSGLFHNSCSKQPQRDYPSTFIASSENIHLAEISIEMPNATYHYYCISQQLLIRTRMIEDPPTLQHCTLSRVSNTWLTYPDGLVVQCVILGYNSNYTIGVATIRLSRALIEDDQVLSRLTQMAARLAEHTHINITFMLLTHLVELTSQAMIS